MGYRILNLVNGNGEIWNLTNKNFKVFATDLDGFGVSRSLSLLRLGLENRITASQYDLSSFGYTVYFYDVSNEDIYQKYNSFIKFLAHKPLYQQYVIPSDKTVFRRKVEILSIGKTEITKDRKILECPVVFQPLSFWEDNEKKIIEAYNTTNEGKSYPLSRPYAYGQTSLSNVRILSAGSLEMPLEITIDGTTIDPSYYIYDESGNRYGAARFVGDFDKLYVNANETDQDIVLTKNGVILDNPFSYQDLTVGSANETQITFFKLKTGISKLVFVLGDSFNGKVTIEWRDRYVSV